MLQLAHLRSSSIGYKEEGYSRKGKLFPGTLWHRALLTLSLQFCVWQHTQSEESEKAKHKTKHKLTTTTKPTQGAGTCHTSMRT